MKRQLKNYPKNPDGSRQRMPDVRPLLQREKPIDIRKGLSRKGQSDPDAVQLSL